MKTKELREYYQELSELNNSFTHYTFVWNQFGIDYLETIKTNSDILTSEYFASNPYRRKHNIKLIDLENEHEKTDKTLIQVIFLLIYSYFESYLKSILEFSQIIDDHIKSIESKLEGVENDAILIDKILNRLSIEKSDLDSDMLNTLDYFRLKRNRLTHQNSENISKSLNQLLKSFGQNLNDYWDMKLPSKRQGIDFSKKENANVINFNIIIDTLNIFRVLSAEIDFRLIEKLSIKSIATKLIIPQFIDLHYKKIKHFSSERKISKFKSYCRTEFAYKATDEIIDLFKSSIA